MALGSPLRTMSVRPDTLAHLLLVHGAPPVATTAPSPDLDEGPSMVATATPMTAGPT